MAVRRCDDVSSKALKMLERMSDYVSDSHKKPISPIVEALAAQQPSSTPPPLTLFCLPPTVSCTQRSVASQSVQPNVTVSTPEPCMLEPLIDIVEEVPEAPMPLPQVLDVSHLTEWR